MTTKTMGSPKSDALALIPAEAERHAEAKEVNAMGKAKQHIQRLTKFIRGENKSNFAPLPSPVGGGARSPPKLVGLCVSKRSGVMQLSRRYVVKLSHGKLKLFKVRDGDVARVGGTPDRVIELAQLDKILCNDESKKFVLCAKSGHLQFQPIDREQYPRWKQGFGEHRRYGLDVLAHSTVVPVLKFDEPLKFVPSIEPGGKMPVVNTERVDTMLKDLEKSLKETSDRQDLENKVGSILQVFSNFMAETAQLHASVLEVVQQLQTQVTDCRQLIQQLRLARCDSCSAVLTVSSSDSDASSFDYNFDEDEVTAVEFTPRDELDVATAIERDREASARALRHAFGVREPRNALPGAPLFGAAIPLMTFFKGCLPIHVYEPLGVMQACCESLRFIGKCLNRLDRVGNPADRMCMVMSFALSCYGAMAHKQRRPFTPLVGETYDHVDAEGWRFHAEQVGLHTLALNATGLGWEFFETVTVSCALSLTGQLRMTQQQPSRLRLANGDEYSWYKVTTVVNNARAEAAQRFLTFDGDLCVTSNTDCVGRLGFADGSRSVRGGVEHEGRLVHKLVGCWDRGLNRVTAAQSQERLFDLPPTRPTDYYGLSEAALAMNQVEEHMQPYLPATDTRRRTDIRHLEAGLGERAEAALRAMDAAKQARAHLQPLWFESRTDPFTAQTYWLTNNRYWPAKEDQFRDEHSRRMVPLPQVD